MQPGHLHSLFVPAMGHLPVCFLKILMPRGRPGGGLGTAGNDSSDIHNCKECTCIPDFNVCTVEYFQFILKVCVLGTKSSTPKNTFVINFLCSLVCVTASQTDGPFNSRENSWNSYLRQFRLSSYQKSIHLPFLSQSPYLVGSGPLGPPFSPVTGFTSSGNGA